MSIVYMVLIHHKFDAMTPNGIPLRDPIFIVVSIIFTALYRHAKWNTEDIRKRKKGKREKGS